MHNFAQQKQQLARSVCGGGGGGKGLVIQAASLKGFFT